MLEALQEQVSAEVQQPPEEGVVDELGAGLSAQRRGDVGGDLADNGGAEQQTDSGPDEEADEDLPVQSESRSFHGCSVPEAMDLRHRCAVLDPLGNDLRKQPSRCSTRRGTRTQHTRTAASEMDSPL
jgi:hypothetical protein